MGAAIAIKPDAKFLRDVAAAGAVDVKKCYQCATCPVVCELSTNDAPIPRPQMLATQWGLRERLMGDPGPWLCFYCGECSKRCPRQANPGEAMMALRRYLTTQYDWTGLSALMYRSAVWEIGILLLVAAVIALLFLAPQSFGFGLLSRHPEALATVRLDWFAPKEVVHVADRILASALGILLLLNAGRMFRALTRGKRIAFAAYWKGIPEFILQMLTQRRWSECADREAKRNWVRHLLLVTGYVTIFTLVVIFLPSFQIEDNSLHWTSFLGYYAAAVLLASTAWMIADRAGKRTEMHRHSQLSDWLFPILLFLTALTGILLHAFRLANWPMTTYVMYTVHMAIAVPMLAVEVPFGKWAHLLYRPVALYLVAVMKANDEVLGIKE
jgi:ferredoxin